MILGLATELKLRKDELQKQEIKAVYFGGGTPSVLSAKEIDFLLQTVTQHYKIAKNAEITIEANPDDLTELYIKELSTTAINRLSVGVQSFFDDDLKIMNRAHSAKEALTALKFAKNYFNNISIDLIYGMPNMSLEKWSQNIDIALDLQIPHISSYALTVEHKTVLQHKVQKGEITMPNEVETEAHFNALVSKLTQSEYIHYELSNFGKENYFSVNNTNYWLGGSYIGIGPGAHSFNGKNRSWNIANNNKYITSINKNKREFEDEVLTPVDLYNEYIMTGLRTQFGVSAEVIKNRFGAEVLGCFKTNIQKHINNNTIDQLESTYKTTLKGKFLSDGISSDLFLVNLEKY